ncbi:MAG: superoxide dismutase family protein [Parachlamydiaceae bacterium]|nr:superoxide dismutase family protein [Parachlamydiaceae bacterium]
MKISYGLLLVAATTVCQHLSAEAPTLVEKKVQPKQANALLNATHGNNAQGYVSFTETPGGVMIVGDFDFLEPGKHALHIHEYGDCSSPDGTSTGANYNPMGSKHGGPDFAIRHVGDLGNVVADEEGHAHYERIDHLIKLDGHHSIMGRSIAVHANADDYITQPAGNAGGRVACGKIE